MGIYNRQRWKNLETKQSYLHSYQYSYSALLHLHQQHEICFMLHDVTVRRTN
jgi:hypothetical protein